MTQTWWELTEADREAAFSFASSKLGLPAHVIEKDVWVVWSLQQVFASPDSGSLTFKGGTSLSKVFGVISRFSEDIDVTFNILDLLSDQSLEGNPIPVSRNHVKRIRRAIDNRLPQWLDDELLPLLVNNLNQTGQAARVSRPDGSRDTVILEYDPIFRGNGYLRPRVKLEFGARTTGLPRATHHVATSIATVIDSVDFPDADVFAMAPERTFWEKATAIHVYCSQSQSIADRFSRHWSDLARLWQSDYGVSALNDRALALDVAQVKDVFYPARDRTGDFIDYRCAVTGGIRLVPPRDERHALQLDYLAMESDGLLEPDGPSFDDVIAVVSDVEHHLNHTNPPT
jgi:hypothetical protein